MRAGHVYIQAKNDDSGIVRIKLSEAMPPVDQADGSQWRTAWVGLFKDCDAGLMHSQNVLCRKLIDIDERTYQVPVGQAIAALETDRLSHSRVYIDDSLSQEVMENEARWEAYYKKKQKIFLFVVRWLSYFFVAYLLFILLFGF